MILNLIAKAKDLFYNNASSGMSATNVQGAIDELNTDLTTLIDWEDVTLAEATYASGTNTYGYIATPSKNDYTPKFVTLLGFGKISHGVYLNVNTFFRTDMSAVYFHVHNPYTSELTTSIIARVFYVKDI